MKTAGAASPCVRGRWRWRTNHLRWGRRRLRATGQICLTSVSQGTRKDGHSAHLPGAQKRGTWGTLPLLRDSEVADLDDGLDVGVVGDILLQLHIVWHDGGCEGFDGIKCE